MRALGKLKIAITELMFSKFPVLFTNTEKESVIVRHTLPPHHYYPPSFYCNIFQMLGSIKI
jgi:hypothetical protein